MKDVRLVILSGPSGAGKSTAMRVLEDLGFFCVDNLPVTLIPKFLELLSQGDEITKAATVVDVREREFLKEFSSIFKEVKASGFSAELFYLDASDSTLIKRFSETRRRHPIESASTPAEGIKAERELLKEIRGAADAVLDTTGFNVHELQAAIKERFSARPRGGRLTINLLSFGYRHGIPPDADIVMDVRFIPNPYFVEELKGKDGRDKSVRDYVMSKKETVDFYEAFRALLNRLIPMYGSEGKSYLTIAVGCTGGRHRSVVIVDELCKDLAAGDIVPKKRHRDVEKE